MMDDGSIAIYVSLEIDRPTTPDRIIHQPALRRGGGGSRGHTDLIARFAEFRVVIIAISAQVFYSPYNSLWRNYVNQWGIK